MMCEEKRYDFTRLELVRRCTKPEAALRSAFGLNESAPAEELKDFCCFRPGHLQKVCDLVGLQRSSCLCQAAEALQCRVHALWKTGPDHRSHFILSEPIVRKEGSRRSDGRQV